MRIQAKLFCFLADCLSIYEYQVSNEDLPWMSGTRGVRCCTEKPSVAFGARFNLLLVNTNLAAYTSLSIVKNTI